MTEEKVKLTDGRVIRVFSINNDMYGNPRYIIHFLSLGLEKYEATALTRKAGLRKYTGRNFGGGYVFQSYGLKEDIEMMLEILAGRKWNEKRPKFEIDKLRWASGNTRHL